MCLSVCVCVCGGGGVKEIKRVKYVHTFIVS